jgi:sugar phosphate isomerase/epimerase
MTLRRPLAIQLYSGRKFPPLESQIAIVASCGFTHVETFGPLNEAPEETRRILDRHGLAAVSTHVSLDDLEGGMTGAIKAARALNVEFVVAPYLSPERRPNDRSGWVALGERLARCRDTIARDCGTDHTQSSTFSARISPGRQISRG